MNWGDNMNKRKVKCGDYVTRKSYGEDVLFKVEKIIKLSNEKENVILKGVTYRIKADSPLDDLCIIDKKTALEIICKLDKDIERYAKEIEETKRLKTQVQTGLILHLDGDALLQKCNYMSADIL